MGGSADLTGSNLTFVKGMGTVRAGNFTGRYIHYGVREHGMAAAANGMALHGGMIPYDRHVLRLHRLHAPGDPHRRASCVRT